MLTNNKSIIDSTLILRIEDDSYWQVSLKFEFEVLHLSLLHQQMSSDPPGESPFLKKPFDLTQSSRSFAVMLFAGEFPHFWQTPLEGVLVYISKGVLGYVFARLNC
jgi:hypothetical protein